MQAATLEDFKSNMNKYLDTIEESYDILVIPREEDKEAIVMMTLSEYNSIMETEYLLSTKENRDVMARSLAQLGK